MLAVLPGGGNIQGEDNGNGLLRHDTRRGEQSGAQKHED